eukprot:scaffold350_cov133-Cylindrotheca_fusiformis.AAC.21
MALALSGIWRSPKTRTNSPKLPMLILSFGVFCCVIMNFHECGCSQVDGFLQPLSCECCLYDTCGTSMVKYVQNEQYVLQVWETNRRSAFPPRNVNILTDVTPARYDDNEQSVRHMWDIYGQVRAE